MSVWLQHSYAACVPKFRETTSTATIRPALLAYSEVTSYKAPFNMWKLFGNNREQQRDARERVRKEQEARKEHERKDQEAKRERERGEQDEKRKRERKEQDEKRERERKQQEDWLEAERRVHAVLHCLRH